MTLDELKERSGGEWLGGRLVAEVDGTRQYLTNVSETGEKSMNELGMRLQLELEAAPAPAAPKPRKVKKEEPVATTDEFQIEL